MTRREQGILDIMQKVQTFEANHIGDFQPNGKAVQCFATNDQLVQQVIEANQAQTPGGRRLRGGALGKSAQGIQVRALLGAVIKTGRRVFRNQPAIESQFRTPRRGTNSELLSDAMVIRNLASVHIQEFLDAEMPADFLEELDSTIAGFESAGRSKNVAEHQRSGESNTVGALLKAGLTNIRDLNPMVRNRYRSDAQVIGEWNTASYLEGPPRKAENSSTPEPTPA